MSAAERGGRPAPVRLLVPARRAVASIACPAHDHHGRFGDAAGSVSIFIR